MSCPSLFANANGWVDKPDSVLTDREPMLIDCSRRMVACQSLPMMKADHQGRLAIRNIFQAFAHLPWPRAGVHMMGACKGRANLLPSSAAANAIGSSLPSIVPASIAGVHLLPTKVEGGPKCESTVLLKKKAIRRVAARLLRAHV
mgnify:CR=1 FL=1